MCVLLVAINVEDWYLTPFAALVVVVKLDDTSCQLTKNSLHSCWLLGSLPFCWKTKRRPGSVSLFEKKHEVAHMRALVVARLSQLVACPHSATFSHTKCPQSKLQYFQFLRTTLASHCNAMHCGSTFLQLQSWPDGGHSGIRNSSLNLTRWILARENHPKPRSMIALHWLPITSWNIQRGPGFCCAGTQLAKLWIVTENIPTKCRYPKISLILKSLGFAGVAPSWQNFE